MTARLTPEEKAHILRLAQSGATLSQIVRKSGRSRPTVSRYCKGANAWRRCGAKEASADTHSRSSIPPVCVERGGV